MRFTVEPWAPEFGPSSDGDLDPSTTEVNLDVEMPEAEWAPCSPVPSSSVPDTVLFTDGVRRVEARVWIDDRRGTAKPGICASYAAGVVRADGHARVVDVQVRRAVFSTAADAEEIVARHASFAPRPAGGDTFEMLSLALQNAMGVLECEVAMAAAEADLIVVDGPVRGREGIPGAVGYVKTHKVAYLPERLEQVLGALRPGQRTPLFLTLGAFSRYSWYLRLPGGGDHFWGGVVRCEMAADQGVAQAVTRADALALLLPRFASEAHKDPRAPQNLYPIAGLEKEMRRRLGDPTLLYRSLRAAAARRNETTAAS